MSTFSIHQFSSGIINPKPNIIGKWLSGGYGQEVAKKSHDVPQEIKTVIKNGPRGFGIEENYPPPMNKYALIARELENYCVLAVANQHKDDANRPLITYRYFWLDKQEFKNQPNVDDFDGIGTLLYYWKKKDCPQYNIEDWTNSPDLYTTSWEGLEKYNIKTTAEFSTQNSTKIQHLISLINSDKRPLICEAHKNGVSLEPEEVHHLAIQYSLEKECFINWAWNVRRLESMKDLRVIYCADAEAVNWFNEQLINHRPTPDTSGSQTAQPSPSHSTGQDEETTNISKLLLKFRHKFSEENVLELMNYYQTYGHNIVDFEDKNIINSCLTNMQSTSNNNIKYATLLTALAPDKKQDIHKELTKLKQNKKEVAIKFLNELLIEVTKNKKCFNHKISQLFYKKITSTIYKLTGSVNRTKTYFPKTYFWLLIFFPYGSLAVAWISWSNIANMRSNVPETSPESIPKQVSLTEQLNKYDNQYEAYKIVKGKGRKGLKNKLYQDKKGIINQLNKAEQHIQDLKYGNSKEVIAARKKPIYTILKQKKFTPEIIADNLPSLNEKTQDKVSVTALQNALKRGGLYKEEQDNYEPGTFDQFTKKAVENLQSGYLENLKLKKQSNTTSMTKDGIVGPNTWNLLTGRLEDLQVEMVYETLKNHLQLENKTDYNIVSEIKICKDNNQNEKALEFVNCLEKLNDKP